MTKKTSIFIVAAMLAASFAGFARARSPMGTAIRRGLSMPNRVTPMLGPRSQWLNVGSIGRSTPMVGPRAQWRNPRFGSSVVAAAPATAPAMAMSNVGAAASLDLGGGFNVLVAPGGNPQPTLGSTSRRYDYSGTGAEPGRRGAASPIGLAADVVSEDLQQRLASQTPQPFSSEWYGNHPQVWRPDAEAFQPWAKGDWSAAAGWVGATASPIYYDCVANDSGVLRMYRNGESIGLAAYSREEAEKLASADVKAASSEKWMSLGVFALVAPKQSAADTLMQISISSQGAIKGALYDLLAGESQAVEGSIDRSSQRTAWATTSSKPLVMETGLSNLTEDASRVVVHKGDGWTQVWHVVRARLPEKATDKAEKPSE